MRYLLPLLLIPWVAQAQEVCAPRDEILSHLAQKYGEKPTGYGPTDTGLVLEMIRKKDDSTWTIIYTRPDGLSCLFASGTGWQEVPRGERL